MLQRQKRQILLCKRDLSRTDVEIFHKPVPVKLSLADITNEFLMSAVGNFDRDFKISKVSNYTASKFSSGDRCYIDVTPGADSDEQCLDADYIVKSLKTTGSVTEILFEGLL